MRSNSRHQWRVGWATSHSQSGPNETGSACLPETGPGPLPEKSRYRLNGHLQRRCRLPKCSPVLLSCCLLSCVFNHGTDQSMELLRKCDIAADFDSALHGGSDQVTTALNDVDEVWFITTNRAVRIMMNLFEADRAVPNRNEPVSDPLNLE